MPEMKVELQVIRVRPDGMVNKTGKKALYNKKKKRILILDDFGSVFSPLILEEGSIIEVRIKE